MKLPSTWRRLMCHAKTIPFPFSFEVSVFLIVLFVCLFICFVGVPVSRFPNWVKRTNFFALFSNDTDEGESRNVREIRGPPEDPPRGPPLRTPTPAENPPPHPTCVVQQVQNCLLFATESFELAENVHVAPRNAAQQRHTTTPLPLRWATRRRLV